MHPAELSYSRFGCAQIGASGHLFHVHARDTARLGRGVADALTRCKKEFGDAAYS